MTVFAVVLAVGVWLARPTTSDDFFRLGIAHLESGEYKGAIQDFGRAIERTEQEQDKSYLPVVYAARAAAYNNEREYESALRDISRAIDLAAGPFGRPDVLPFDLHRSATFISQGTMANWHLARANVLVALGKKQDAIPDLRIVLKHDAKNQGAVNLLAIAEGRQQIDI